MRATNLKTKEYEYRGHVIRVAYNYMSAQWRMKIDGQDIGHFHGPIVAKNHAQFVLDQAEVGR